MRRGMHVKREAARLFVCVQTLLSALCMCVCARALSSVVAPHAPRTSLRAVFTFASGGLKAYSIELKRACFVVTAASPKASRACGSVSPMVPIGGCEKTTVAMDASYSSIMSSASIGRRKIRP